MSNRVIGIDFISFLMVAANHFYFSTVEFGDVSTIPLESLPDDIVVNAIQLDLYNTKNLLIATRTAVYKVPIEEPSKVTLIAGNETNTGKIF